MEETSRNKNIDLINAAMPKLSQSIKYLKTNCVDMEGDDPTLAALVESGKQFLIKLQDMLAQCSMYKAKKTDSPPIANSKDVNHLITSANKSCGLIQHMRNQEE